jgi:hypothetical protein
MSTSETAGFFTLGVPAERYHLPHPHLSLPVLLLIRRMLLRAFELLRAQNFNLADAKEDEVTAALRRTIENNLRQTGEVPGFDKRKFETVIRQGQWANYDGKSLTKAPDLFFKLRDDESEPRLVLSEHDGLFIETKPVDATHTVGSKYCDDGLIRFVRGDYAWAMQEAMMLAYARSDRTIKRFLLPAMPEARRMSTLQTQQLPTRLTMEMAGSTPAAEAVYLSRHERTFQWPDSKGQATPIDIFHVWCVCDTLCQPRTSKANESKVF